MTLLRQLHPAGDGGETFAESDSIRLISDAPSRLFDTTIQAIGRLRTGDADLLVARALTESRSALDEDALERLARLPGFEVPPGATPPTLGQLFEAAWPTASDEDELGC